MSDETRPGRLPPAGVTAAPPTPNELLTLADQCVKCGYCLPHCPTFRLRHDEAESPRGRIALIQGWLTGGLAYGSGATDAGAGLPGRRASHHLDNCLECLACEPVCPSLVRVGALMDGARALREARRPVWQRWPRRVLLGLLASPRRLPLLARMAGLSERLGIGRLSRAMARRLPRLAMLGRLAGAVQAPVPLTGDPRAPAALFLGCVARATQQPTAAATLRVLARLGIAVAVPDDQTCCGAMHRHNGLPGPAERLLAVNAAVFAGHTAVGFASACVAELRQHSGIDAAELCRFLVDAEWPPGLAIAPLDATVAVHEPCSHRNQLRDTGAIYRLLECIPGVRVVPLPGNDTCCGAAGTYLIEHPETAAALAEPKIAALRDLDARILVSTNTGCALHLAAQAAAAGLAVEVLHPVELLDRQLAAT